MIKRNSDQLASSVEKESKRPSASRLSGGQMSIEDGMSASAMTILSASVAALINGEGICFLV